MKTSKYVPTGNSIVPYAINAENQSKIEKLRDHLVSNWPYNVNPSEKERFIGMIDAMIFSFEQNSDILTTVFNYNLMAQGPLTALYVPIQLKSTSHPQIHKMILSKDSLHFVAEGMKLVDMNFNQTYNDFQL